MTPVLWGRASSANVQKVMWAAIEAGIAHEQVPAGGPHGRTDTDAYAAMNPTRRVPVWVEGDLVLWESDAILRHLARRAPAALRPEALHRAVVDQWMSFAATALLPPFVGVFWQAVRLPRAERSADAMTRHLAALDAALDVLEGRCAAAPWLGGAAFSIADIAAGVVMHRYHDMDIPRPARPALADWTARLAARPAWGRVVATD